MIYVCASARVCLHLIPTARLSVYACVSVLGCVCPSLSATVHLHTCLPVCMPTMAVYPSPSYSYSVSRRSLFFRLPTFEREPHATATITGRREGGEGGGILGGKPDRDGNTSEADDAATAAAANSSPSQSNRHQKPYECLFALHVRCVGQDSFAKTLEHIEITLYYVLLYNVLSEERDRLIIARDCFVSNRGSQVL